MDDDLQPCCENTKANPINQIKHEKNDMIEIVKTVSVIVSGVAIPLLGIFLFFDSKKREAKAKADKAESENITKYAEQWRILYEEKCKHEEELNAKIDTLYVQLGQQREELAKLKKEMAELMVRSQYAESQKCTVYGCPNRQPPQLICATSNHPEQ